MLKAAKAYFETQVTTTTQGDLLVMLYDGAIKYLNQAKAMIEEKNYAQKGMLISRAMDVISELDESLNREKGGEVAQNLHQLYFYCNTRLLRANLEMNTKLIDEIVRILDALRDAFSRIKATAPQAAEGQGAQAPQQPAPEQAAPPAPPAPEPQAAQPPKPGQAGEPAPREPQPAPGRTNQTYGPGATLRAVRPTSSGTYAPNGTRR